MNEFKSNKIIFMNDKNNLKISKNKKNIFEEIHIYKI